MAKIDGIAYVACTCPDIDLAERFLGDFGTVRAACDAGTLNIRGAGPVTFLSFWGPPVPADFLD
jgi:hypothetical protein